MPKKKADESMFRKKLLEEIQNTKGGLRRIVDNEVLLTPPLDGYETDNEFILISMMPGVGKDDVDIRVEDGVLIIEEKKASMKKGPDGNHIVREVERGRYFRKFHLTEDIDLSDMKGTIDKGILTITLKKKEVIADQKNEGAEETQEETEKSKKTVKTLVQKPIIEEDEDEDESKFKGRIKKKK